MNKEQIVSFLHLLGVTAPADQSRGGWVVSKCPMGKWRHDNGTSLPRVFGIRIEPGDGLCNCFSCGWAGKQSDLVTMMALLNRQNPATLKKFQFGKAMELVFAAEENIELSFDTPGVEELLFEKKKPLVFEESWLASFAMAWDDEEARAYLQSRQVSADYAWLFQLHWDSKKRRVCFPIRDFKKQLRGLHGRAIDKDVELRYLAYTPHGKMNPDIWLGENWVNLDQPILIVEGPFDLLSAYRVYANVVSPLYANPSVAKLHRMQDCLEWVTLLDRGSGGEAGRKKISKVMTGHSITHLLPPEGEDPGSCSTEQLREVLGPYLDVD